MAFIAALQKLFRDYETLLNDYKPISALETLPLPIKAPPLNTATTTTTTTTATTTVTATTATTTTTTTATTAATTTTTTINFSTIDHQNIYEYLNDF